MPEMKININIKALDAESFIKHLKENKFMIRRPRPEHLRFVYGKSSRDKETPEHIKDWNMLYYWVKQVEKGEITKKEFWEIVREDIF